MPIYFVSVVLASAATSVPDTIISYKDAMKGNYDDAVANALGSNIFDVCFALGLPLFLFTLIYGPIEMSSETIENVGQLSSTTSINHCCVSNLCVCKKRNKAHSC